MPYNIERMIEIINDRDHWTNTSADQIRRLADVPAGKTTLNDRQLNTVINKLYMGPQHRIYRTQLYGWLQEATTKKGELS